MKNKAPCHNQKFGHNFPVAGGDCTQCGINQKVLSKNFKKTGKYEIKKPVRGIHSEMHSLAKDISEYCNEPKKFGMYLGIIKNTGLKRAYKMFSELKQSPNAKTKGKLFVYKSKYQE